MNSQAFWGELQGALPPFSLGVPHPFKCGLEFRYVSAQVSKPQANAFGVNAVPLCGRARAGFFGRVRLCVPAARVVFLCVFGGAVVCVRLCAFMCLFVRVHPSARRVLSAYVCVRVYAFLRVCL